MEKNFSKMDQTQMRAVAKAAYAYIEKVKIINEKISKVEEEAMAKAHQSIINKTKKLNVEKENLMPVLNGFNESFKNMTKGYTIEDLMTFVEEPTGKLKKDGTESVTIRAEFKYPETITPPTTEVQEDAAVSESNEEPAVADYEVQPPMPEFGNDFDLDKEKIETSSSIDEFFG